MIGQTDAMQSALDSLIQLSDWWCAAVCRIGGMDVGIISDHYIKLLSRKISSL